MIEQGRDPLPPAHGDSRFIDLDMLDMLGPIRGAPASPVPSDPLDRLLDNCEFRFCPVLKVKLNLEVRENISHQGTLGLAFCHWPAHSRKAPATWGELQYKPKVSKWVEGIKLSTDRCSIQLASRKLALPRWTRMVFQGSVGLGIGKGKGGSLRLLPLLQYRVSARTCVNQVYKQQWTHGNMCLRTGIMAAVHLPELGGGVGHVDDHAFEFVDPGLQVAVQQISARWRLGGARAARHTPDGTNEGVRGWWIPHTWSSSSLI